MKLAATSFTSLAATPRTKLSTPRLGPSLQAGENHVPGSLVNSTLKLPTAATTTIPAACAWAIGVS